MSSCRQNLLQSSDNNEETQTTELLANGNTFKNSMDSNRLKMNASKTDFISLGSRQQLLNCQSENICVDDATKNNLETLKYLVVTLDRSIKLRKHITIKCRTEMWQLRRIRSIRKMLTTEACQTLVLSLVISHRDYANGLMPKCDIKRIQRVQNIASKLVILGEDDVSQHLKTLHWLLIHLRVQYIQCQIVK